MGHETGTNLEKLANMGVFGQVNTKIHLKDIGQEVSSRVE
jgi:hypothetical protein